MRLRSISKNVKDQNWFAVVLDFLIVVLGVYIGIQLGNWNDDRKTKDAYADARVRYMAETDANIEAADQFLIDVSRRLEFAQSAIEVLRECRTGDEAQSSVDMGLNIIRGTGFLRIRTTALKSLTDNEAFLSQMDEGQREALKEMLRTITQTQKTIDWLEEQPFKNHIEDHSAIRFGDLTALPGSDETKIRMLKLDVPLVQACQDDALLRSFYLWERTATFQRLRVQQIRESFAEVRDAATD